jgi:hypothetical protein
VGFNGYYQRWEVYEPAPSRWLNAANAVFTLISIGSAVVAVMRSLP